MERHAKAPPIGEPKEEVKTVPAAPKQSGKILGVQVLDRKNETVVKLTGSTPFQDYEFQRVGEDQFLLKIAGVSGGADLPALPATSRRVSLSFSGDALSGDVQLEGSLTHPFDQHLLDAAGSDLVLRLSHGQAAAKGSGKRPVRMDAGADLENGFSRSSKSANRGEPSRRTSTRDADTARVESRGADPRSGMGPTGSQDAEAQSAPLKKQYTGKPISLDLLEADLRNVLRLLADISGTNIVIEPDVAGKVTLKVEQVPWDQVLDMVLSMNDLGKEQVGSVIRIAKEDELRQEWAEQAKEIKAQQELMEVVRDIGEPNTVYLSVNYAQPKDIADRIREVKSDNGRVSVDERTSLIIYSDYPARIERARQLLSRLDKPTPQVLIEARLVTMSAELTRSLGINWGLNFTHIGSNKEDAPFTKDFAINSPPGDLFEMAIAQVVGETLINVDLRLSALETANQLNIVAAPRVLTINNVKATITQGTQIPFLQRDESGSSTEFKDATIELQVTPHITPDRKVRLEIQAKQDEPTASNFTVGDSELPGIDTRKISTELLVDDGNIVVIGGVIRDRETKANTATPGMHRIPILGRLFKSETVGKSKTELLIFISPKIVEASGSV